MFKLMDVIFRMLFSWVKRILLDSDTYFVTPILLKNDSL